MSSLFKRNKNKIEVPKWASFFDQYQYSTFLKAIEHYFYTNNITYTFGDGMLSAGPNDFGFDKMGLTNVAQVCKLDEPGNYQDVVKYHFDTFAKNKLFDKEFKKIITDFEQVKDYIGVRLYPDDYIPETAKQVSMWKNFAGDIIALLVFDLPHSVQSITTDEAQKWNKTFDELFETGLKNIQEKYPPEISKEKFSEFEIWFIQASHFYAPNIIFDFELQQKLMGAYGSLIGIPHRHAVIIYPIENIKVVEALNALIPTIYGMNQEGPGSISNNIFWYKDGHYEDLPYKIEDNKIQFYPPEDFLQLLNTLEEPE
jgi:hypothetical protein